MTFGEKLSKLRKEANYTQEQLADILGVSRQSVSKWESNMAYPETDKLICLARLFECSTDYLLKDEYTDKGNAAISNNSSSKAEFSAKQKMIGYILLAVSLISGILICLLADSTEELFILIPIVLSILVCSLICLFVERKAGYWCVWVVFAPIALISPYIIGLSLPNGLNFPLLCFYVIMFFVARKLFANEEISTNRKRSRVVIVCWAALVGLHVFSYISAYTSVISSAIGWLPYSLSNLFTYIGFALLMPYTVCYVANLKRSKL